MKGCLTAVAILLVVIAGGGLFIWLNWDTVSTKMTEFTESFEMPEHGKKEYIDKDYGEFLRSLDAAAENENSLMSFGAALEKIKLPDNIVYIEINKGDDKTEVFKKYSWSSTSTFIMGGYGAGTIGGVKVMLYKNEGPWDYMDNFIVYIEYTEDANERRL